MMNIIKKDIEGVVIIEPRVFEDERGYFFESFSEREFLAEVGEYHFVQSNEVKSSYGVVSCPLTHRASWCVWQRAVSWM